MTDSKNLCFKCEQWTPPYLLLTCSSCSKKKKVKQVFCEKCILNHAQQGHKIIDWKGNKVEKDTLCLADTNLTGLSAESTPHKLVSNQVVNGQLNFRTLNTVTDFFGENYQVRFTGGDSVEVRRFSVLEPDAERIIEWTGSIEGASCVQRIMGTCNRDFNAVALTWNKTAFLVSNRDKMVRPIDYPVMYNDVTCILSRMDEV